MISSYPRYVTDIRKWAILNVEFAFFKNLESMAILPYWVNLKKSFDSNILKHITS